MDSPSSEPIDLCFKTPQIPKRRSSFFNYENTKEYEENLKTAAYMDKLKNEEKDWVKVMVAARAKCRELIHVPKPILDSSILSKERQDYLNNAVDTQKYLDGLQDFTTKALFYIKKKEWKQKKLQYCSEMLDGKLREIVTNRLSSRSHDIPRDD